jgi:hypothetical protein
MRNKVLLLGLMIVSFSACDKKELGKDSVKEKPCNFINFKYYQNEKLHLGELAGDFIIVGIDSNYDDKLIQNLVKSKDYFDHQYDFKINRHSHYPYKYIALKLNRVYACNSIAWIIDDMKKSTLISYAHYTMLTDDCRNMIWEKMGERCVNSYSSLFYVKVKDTADLSGLNQTLIETNTKIKSQNQFMSHWYTLVADKHSKGDAHSMANYFHETGLFEACDHNIIKIAVE